jgi:hypothetical protein
MTKLFLRHGEFWFQGDKVCITLQPGISGTSKIGFQNNFLPLEALGEIRPGIISQRYCDLTWQISGALQN